MVEEINQSIKRWRKKEEKIKETEKGKMDVLRQFKKCYVHNIFTTNYKWLVVIGSNLSLALRLLF